MKRDLAYLYGSCMELCHCLIFKVSTLSTSLLFAERQWNESMTGALIGRHEWTNQSVPINTIFFRWTKTKGARIQCLWLASTNELTNHSAKHAFVSISLNVKKKNLLREQNAERALISVWLNIKQTCTKASV